MPWKEVTVMSQRLDFVRLAKRCGANIAELCRRFGISRKTGYKWMNRFEELGFEGLRDRPRRPHHSPVQTPQHMEQAILDIRDAHQAWGGRKLQARMRHLGHSNVPAPSTITEILRRNGRLNPQEAAKHKPWQRFEHESPNDLWQIDFKGDIRTDAGRCYPLTVLDDHSRYSILIQACSDKRGDTVQRCLIPAFERYGLPWRILADNGGPWTGGHGSEYSPLVVWLIRLGIDVWHARPYHPQTQGKQERFHRTLEAELIRYQRFADIQDCHAHLCRWRDEYNHDRPHEVLDMATPASRYKVSPRAYPSELPPIEYGPVDKVRKVQQDGCISYGNRLYLVGKAFRGYPVAVRPTLTDGIFDIHFCHKKITHLDLTLPDQES
ncbi:MAG: IS481 family transposase [Anaerolineae bacterium]|nr:IS481 family transposase [Anaerolineae bacterium]NIN97301.1 IS481 family transposase [Anaerolineae bacterium]